jgi:ferredoxin
VQELAGLMRHILSWMDRLMNRIFGWRYNPLYQSGSLVVVSLVVMLVTGLYLLLFYRIGGPYASIERISAQAWGGSWIRASHRYAADVAVVAALVHAARMFSQGRSWGPRVLAWLSGLVLVGLLYICAWTGYVMVWDGHGFVLAVEGARLLDALPLFSEPIVRTFVGERPIPGAFFFLNLFLHIAVPIGMAAGLWLHVSRVSRPVLVPPRPLWIGSVVALFAVSVLWPAPLDGPADPLLIPTDVKLDVLYGFWLPILQNIGPGVAWAAIVIGMTGLCAIPWLTRPKSDHQPEPSHVDQRSCTSCYQCYLDCPYEAIAMVNRTDGRDGMVAYVDPALCVSCGICAGSCAPMGVGPPLRTGKHQLAEVEAFIAEQKPTRDQVVIVGCDRSVVEGRAGSPVTALLENEGVGSSQGGSSPVLSVTCAGNLHSSVVEYLVRAGAGGVLVVACPPRDCWSREGPIWMEQRFFHERGADLKERVDRARIRIAYAASGESAALGVALRDFREDVAALADESVEETIDILAECESADGLTSEVGR